MAEFIGPCRTCEKFDALYRDEENHVCCWRCQLRVERSYVSQYRDAYIKTAGLLAEVYRQYDNRNNDYRSCANGEDLPDTHEMTLYLSAKVIREARRISS